MFGGTAHVVLGSGLTIAGATFCLHFTNLPYFQTLGIPLAIGMVVVVAAALTLGPAVISVVSRFRQVLEPKRSQRGQLQRDLFRDVADRVAALVTVHTRIRQLADADAVHDNDNGSGKWRHA